MGRNTKDVELEKSRVMDEALANGGQQMRYFELARKVKGHPVFAGVRFVALAQYVRLYVLRKNSPYSRQNSENSSNKKRVQKSGFDVVKDDIQFKRRVSFEDVRRISDAVEQIRPYYERLEIENRKLTACLESAVAAKTTAESELRGARCYDCETYRAECDEKVSKALGEKSQLMAKLQETGAELEVVRERLRKNAMAYS